MKALIFGLAVIAATSTVATAQKIAMAPESVKNSFSARFPNRQIKSWRKINETYVAAFVSDDKKYKVTFTSDGKWVKTETRIKWKDVPTPVKAAFENSEYISWQRTGVLEMESPGSQPVYVIHVNNGNSLDADHYAFKDDYTLFLTPEGKWLKKEKEC